MKFLSSVQAFFLLLIFCTPGLMKGQDVFLEADQGVSFYQIDFTFTNAELANSSIGMAVADFPLLAEFVPFSPGYINIFAFQGGWIVRNMPVAFDAEMPGISTWFDLGAMGDVDFIVAAVVVSEEPKDFFFAEILFDYPVGDKPYNAEGLDESITTAPASIDLSNVIFDPFGPTLFCWRKGPPPNIEQDDNQCAPAAVANSLQWLENDGDIVVPDDHKPGIRDASLVGELDKRMDRAAHQGCVPSKILEGKVKYVDDKGLKDKLNLKHKNRVGGSTISSMDVTVGGTTSAANSDATVSLFDWMLSELKDGEDVELIYLYDGGGGHAVNLVGAGYIMGIPTIAWAHDANQGSNDNGTPGNTADDTTDETNGGTTPADGGIGWSPIIGDRVVSQGANMAFALSESEKPTAAYEIPEEAGFRWLHEGHPNPFQETINIAFEVEEKADISLVVFSSYGEEIYRLTDETFDPGRHFFSWSAISDSGKLVPPGIYLCRAQITFPASGQQYIQSKTWLFVGEIEKKPHLPGWGFSFK